jgi:hypothetical protein
VLRKTIPTSSVFTRYFFFSIMNQPAEAFSSLFERVGGMMLDSTSMFLSFPTVRRGEVRRGEGGGEQRGERRT